MEKLELQSKWRSNSKLRYLMVGALNTVVSATLFYVLLFLFNNKFYE